MSAHGPELVKRASLRTQKRMEDPVATAHDTADRDSPMHQDFLVEEDLHGQQPQEYSTRPPQPHLSRQGTDHSESLNSQVEAVTALSSLFGQQIANSHLLLEQQEQQPEEEQEQLEEEQQQDDDQQQQHFPSSHMSLITSPPPPQTPSNMQQLSATPTLLQQQQQSFFSQQNYISQSFSGASPPFAMPSLLSPNHLLSPSNLFHQQQQMLVNQAAVAAAASMQSPQSMLQHINSIHNSQFLSPPPVVSPMSGYRAFHLTPPALMQGGGGNASGVGGNHPPISHSSPYHSTRLPILHSWYFRNKLAQHPARGPMEIPAPEYATSAKVNLHGGVGEFVESLREVLRGNARVMAKCLPLDDLTSNPQFINALQYSRYLRRSSHRRLLRLSRQARGSSTLKHVSRQLHAARRVRGKGGRFLTKEEKEQMAREEKRRQSGGGGGGGGMQEEAEEEEEDEE